MLSCYNRIDLSPIINVETMCYLEVISNVIPTHKDFLIYRLNFLSSQLLLIDIDLKN